MELNPQDLSAAGPQSVWVAGIGFRAMATRRDVLSVVAQVCELAEIDVGAITLFAVSAHKRDTTLMNDIKQTVEIPIVYVAQGDLSAAASRCHTHSARLQRLVGNSASQAEAAALAAAGASSRLVVSRRHNGRASCCLAVSEQVSLAPETAR